MSRDKVSYHILQANIRCNRLPRGAAAIRVDKLVMLKVDSNLYGSLGRCANLESGIHKLQLSIPADWYVHSSPGIDIQVVVEAERVTAPKRKDVRPVGLPDPAALLRNFPIPGFVTRADPPTAKALFEVVIDNIGINIELIVFKAGLRCEVRCGYVCSHESSPPFAIASHG